MLMARIATIEAENAELKRAQQVQASLSASRRVYAVTLTLLLNSHKQLSHLLMSLLRRRVHQEL